MADIFVSYAREDRSKIERLVDLLELQGWSVWWDREINPGAAFSKVIEREIANAHCLIVAWSQHSVTSDWVHAEANEGLHRHMLIPVRFEPVDVPLIFRQTQAANLAGWPTHHNDEEVSGLLNAVGEALSKPPQDIRLRTTTKRRSRFPVGAIIIVAVLAIAGVTWLNLKPPVNPDRSNPVSTAKGLAPSITVEPFRNMDRNISGAVASALMQSGQLLVLEPNDKDSASGSTIFSLKGIQTGQSLVISLFDNREGATRATFEVDLSKVSMHSATRTISQRLSNQLGLTIKQETTVIPDEPYLEYLTTRSGMREGSSPDQLLLEIAKLENLVQAYPRFSEAQASLCTGYVRVYRYTGDVGNFEQAEKNCFRAARLSGGTPWILTAMGDLYKSAGQLPEARENYASALELAPSLTHATRGLAQVRASQGDIPGAERLLRRAQINEPHNWRNFETLGAIFFLNGKFDEAIPEYQRALALQEDSPVLLSDLGAAYFMVEDFANATRYWEASLAMSPNARALSNLGSAYYFQGEFDQALATYELAIADSTSDYTYWLNAGQAAFHAGADYGRYYHKAIELAEAQLTVNPDAAEVLSALALCNASTGNPEQAKDLINRALIAGGGDIYVLYDIAVAYGRLGNTSEMQRVLQRMIKNGYSESLINADANFAKQGEVL